MLIKCSSNAHVSSGCDSGGSDCSRSGSDGDVVVVVVVVVIDGSSEVVCIKPGRDSSSTLLARMPLMTWR